MHCVCAGRSSLRHRTREMVYIWIYISDVNEHFIAAVNSSDRCGCRIPNCNFAIHECVYIIHMTYDADTKIHGRHVIFEPFIWWHDVIEPHKESLCRHTYASMVKMESQTNEKGRWWQRNKQTKMEYCYENTQESTKRVYDIQFPKETIVVSTSKRSTSVRPLCIRIHFV